MQKSVQVFRPGRGFLRRQPDRDRHQQYLCKSSNSFCKLASSYCRLTTPTALASVGSSGAAIHIFEHSCLTDKTHCKTKMSTSIFRSPKTRSRQIGERGSSHWWSKSSLFYGPTPTVYCSIAHQSLVLLTAFRSPTLLCADPLFRWSRHSLVSTKANFCTPYMYRDFRSVERFLDERNCSYVLCSPWYHETFNISQNSFVLSGSMVIVKKSGSAARHLSLNWFVHVRAPDIQFSALRDWILRPKGPVFDSSSERYSF